MQAALALTGGTIVDGTGGPGRPGTVLVEAGRVRLAESDALLPAATRRIDATGLVVAPGFIDLHSHSGLMLFADRRHEPKVRQGVTTEVIGVDGLSYAPFRDRDDLLALVQLNAGLDGRPDEHTDYGWSSLGEYLDRLDGMAVNVALLVGNTALRIDALGWDDIPVHERALERMRSTLREAMQEGAWGLSSGLDYPPGSYATTDELAGLAREAAGLGGFYHTHVR